MAKFHLRFAALLLGAVVISTVAYLLMHEIVEGLVVQVIDVALWLIAAVQTEEFWITTFFLVLIWLKKSIIKSVMLAIIMPFVSVVLMVSLFDTKKRRRLRTVVEAVKRKVTASMEYLREKFVIVFGGYSAEAMVVTAISSLWGVVAVGWHVVAWTAAVGLVQQIGTWLRWVSQPLVEAAGPYVQAALRGLHERLPAAGRLLGQLWGAMSRLMTGGFPFVHRLQRWTGRRFIRLLIRTRMVRGDLHRRAVKRIQTLRQARAEKTRARMLGLAPDGMPGMGWGGRNYGMRHEHTSRCVSDRTWARLMLGATLRPTLYEGATVSGRPVRR